jgi:mRNA-degrading endonuclease toxin of MazEF toxin-antitoxin module
LRQFDIFLAEFTWRDCTDKRPCVVMAPDWYIDGCPRENVLVAPMSANIDLVAPRRHFALDPTQPDTPETGLLKPCYVAVDYMTHVDRADLKKRLGKLPQAVASQLARFTVEFLFGGKLTS